MATIIPAGTAVRASLIGTLYGDVNDIVNTMWFRSEGTGGALEDLGAGILQDWVNALRPSTLVAFQWNAINMVSYPPPATNSLLYSTGFPVVGTNADTASIAPATAYTVTFTTGFAGRAHRGRVFICGAASTFFANGLITPASLSTLQATWAGILADLVGIAQWTPVVAHTRVKNPAWQPNPLLVPFDRRRTIPASPAVFTPIVDATVRNVQRQQRRREIGVSRHGARGGPVTVH